MLKIDDRSSQIFGTRFVANINAFGNNGFSNFLKVIVGLEGNVIAGAKTIIDDFFEDKNFKSNLNEIEERSETLQKKENQSPKNDSPQSSEVLKDEVITQADAKQLLAALKNESRPFSFLHVISKNYQEEKIDGAEANSSLQKLLTLLWQAKDNPHPDSTKAKIKEELTRLYLICERTGKNGRLQSLIKGNEHLSAYLLKDDAYEKISKQVEALVSEKSSVLGRISKE